MLTDKVVDKFEWNFFIALANSESFHQREAGDLHWWLWKVLEQMKTTNVVANAEKKWQKTPISAWRFANPCNRADRKGEIIRRKMEEKNKTLRWITNSCAFFISLSYLPRERQINCNVYAELTTDVFCSFWR